MPFAATVYSLLLASSAVTTPAIEELTAIRQRELTEEEIAAQIEESRIERIESQFDGHELPQEIEAAAQAETPSGAAPASQTVRETVSEPVYPTEIQPSAVVAEPTAVSPQPVGGIRETTVTESADGIRETAITVSGQPLTPPTPITPAAAEAASEPVVAEKTEPVETLKIDPSVAVVVTGETVPASPLTPGTTATSETAQVASYSPAPVVPQQGFVIEPVSKADYTLVPPATLSSNLLPAHFGEELEGDEDILAARKAAQKNDVAQLKTLAARVKNHPLGGYVELWEINAQAEQDLKKNKKLTAAVEKRYARFIEMHESEYLAERARTDWLRYAAQANDAKRFAALYPKLKWNREERDILCMRQTFALGSGKPSAQALAQAKSLLLRTTAPQIDACKKLAARTLEADRSWTWQYLLILLQKKRYTLATQLVKETPAKYLPVNKKELSQILTNPSRWLQRNRKVLKKKPVRLLIAASLRIVQKDIGAAVTIAHATDGRINSSTKALLWGRIGYEAAVDQDAASLRYYKLAGEGLKSAASSTLIVNGATVLVWQARAALRNGTPQEVLSALSQLSPSVKKADNWTYWRARMLAAVGKKAQADKLMQSLVRGYEFYNLLAADFLGKPYYKGPESMKPEPSKESFAKFSKNPSVQRAVRFYALGLPYEGHREWNWALIGMKNRERLEIAEYAGALGLEHRRINTAASTGRAAAFNQLYPKPFADKINRAADEAQLPQNLVFGLIRQESRFISLALSSAGARGLMQVMPSTARWVAKQTGLKGYSNSKISDIDTNLFLGTQYLRLVRENVSPNVTLATASYNAGPSKAAAWRSTLTKEVEGALFAETIPYSETRDYVMRVTANTVQYSRYTNDPIHLMDLLGRIEPVPLSGNIIP